jgi:hypothetical protein
MSQILKPLQSFSKTIMIETGPTTDKGMQLAIDYIGPKFNNVDASKYEPQLKTCQHPYNMVQTVGFSICLSNVIIDDKPYHTIQFLNQGDKIIKFFTNYVLYPGHTSFRKFDKLMLKSKDMDLIQIPGRKIILLNTVELDHKLLSIKQAINDPVSEISFLILDNGLIPISYSTSKRKPNVLRLLDKNKNDKHLIDYAYGELRYSEVNLIIPEIKIDKKARFLLALKLLNSGDELKITTEDDVRTNLSVGFEKFGLKLDIGMFGSFKKINELSTNLEDDEVRLFCSVGELSYIGGELLTQWPAFEWVKWKVDRMRNVPIAAGVICNHEVMMDRELLSITQKDDILLKINNKVPILLC